MRARIVVLTRRFRLLIAMILLFSGATEAWAACENAAGQITSFKVLDSPASRSGTFEIGYAFSGNPSERVVNVYRNGEHWRFANNLSTSGIVTLDNNVFCLNGDYEFTAKTYTGCANEVVGESTVTKHYDSHPKAEGLDVTFSHNGELPLMTVSVDYEFPYIDTAPPSEKRLDVYLDGIIHYSLFVDYLADPPQLWKGNRTFTAPFPCLGTGTHTVVVQAVSGCGLTSDSEPFRFPVKNPKITSLTVEPLDAAGNFLATVGYAFETTHENRNERRIDLYWNGVHAAGSDELAMQGTATFTFNQGCMSTPGTAQSNTVKAVAVACGNFRDEKDVAVPLPTEKGNIDIERVLDTETEKIRLAVTHTLPPGVLSATRVVRVLRYVLENGDEVASGAELRRDTVGPGERIEFDYVPPAALAGHTVRIRTIIFEATLSFCNQQVRDEVAVDCGCDSMQPRTGSPDPVSWEDGNMRYADSDPLPPLLDSVRLTRNYDTHHRVRGSFGLGWVTMFEGRLLVNTDPAGQTITLTNANNETAVFFGRDGIYKQLWPKGRASTGSLVLEAASALYVHRPAGSSTASLYRSSDGRFVGLRRMGRGREMRVTWTSAGLPQSVSDSWTSLTWNITVDATNRRITSIEAAGLVWQYQYDASGNLASVLAPAASAWRTYTYVSDLMTAARDASGNLIESHAYDPSGRAIDSTGPNDEIQSVQYKAPGTTSTQLVTRVTMKTGAVAEYTLQAVGGSWRTVRISGGCTSCGARDGVYAYDGDGHLIREQDANGYIAVSTYSGQRLVSTQQHLRPAGCDPESSPTHCMLDPVTLKDAVAFDPTAATITTEYRYGDPLWPDKPTETVTPSIVATGQSRKEQFTYHAATGEAIGHTIFGWIDDEGEPIDEQHITRTVLYGDSSAGGGDDEDDPGDTADPHAPAFDPGGTFLSAWLALPQPHLMRKAIDGPRSDVEDVTTFVYYPIDASVPASLRGRLAAVRNAAAHISRYESYDTFGNPTRMVDANGAATEMTYDVIGRLSSSTIKGIPACDTTKDALCATDLTATRSYASPAGPLQREQRAMGGVTVYTYDARGRVATISSGPSASDLRERIEYTYDSLTGQKSVEKLLAFENGTWAEKKRESFSYDSLRQLQATTHADETAIHYTYDSDGRIASTRDENHTSPNTVFSYDPAGRTSTVKQTLAGAPGGFVTTSYTYDIHGNLNTVTDPNGNVTSYTYDDFGRLRQQQSPVSGTTRYRYDDAGNVTLTIDANGVSTQRSYDSLGRVTSSVASNGSSIETVTWSYDDPTAGRFAIGRLSSMTDPTGSTTYAYDRRGLLREEAKTIGGAAYTTAYQHDGNGNRSIIRYPSGRAVNYAFDFADRPQSASTGGTPLVISARYLPFGPMTEMVLGNGTTKRMEYDNRYRITRNELTGADDPIASYSYAYDNASNITQLHDLNDVSFNRNFGYDDLHRLTTANTGEALWGEGSYSYDAMGNLLSLSLGRNRTAAFSYAATTSKLASVIEGESQRTVAYDAAGNETAVGPGISSYTPRNLLGSYGGVTYTYDGRGVRTMTSRATQIVSFVIDPNTVGGGDPSQGTITLSGVAPSVGAIIILTASSTIIGIPASVTVPAGLQSVTFAIQTQAVQEQVNVILNASFSGFSQSQTLTIAPPRLDSLVVAPQSVMGGEETIATVTLLGTAPEGGMTVALESNSLAAVVPSQILIPGGARSAQVPVQTTPVGERTRATISASAGSDGAETSLMILPPVIDRLAFSPASLHSGTTTGTITLTGAAPTQGAIVALVTEAEALSLPSNVTVPEGARSASFPASATPVEHDTSARVTAILGESTYEALVRITAPVLTDFSVTPAIVVGGEPATAQTVLDAPAAAGGAPVQVTSSDPATIPSPDSIVVPEGSTSKSAALPTLPVAASTPVIVSATRNGVTRSATVTVQPPQVTIASLAIAPSSLIGTNPATGTVTLSDAAPASGAEVELLSSHPTIASIPSALSIPAGATSGTFPIATSLVTAAQPVSITAAHATTEKTSTLTVLPPSGNYVSSISVVPSFIVVGASATATVTLAMPSDHTSDVALTSSNAALLTVPSKVTVKNKDTAASFSVSTSSVTVPTAVTVTASFGGVVQHARLIVAPPNAVTLASLTITPSRVTGGNSATGIVTLTAAAPAGGAPVTVTPRRRNMVIVPATVTVPEGATSAAFAIATDVVYGKKDKSTEIDASYNGVTASATIAIAPQISASTPSRAVAQCASLALAPCLTRSALDAINVLSTSIERSYKLYSPELNLLAETVASQAADPSIAYEYVWFAGQPLAQIETSTNTIHWYFNDHLGTPILQTDVNAREIWRPEYEPYGTVFAFRRGEAKHQPLRFPGQESDPSSEITYNIFRWYQSRWGRYAAADPLALNGGMNLYSYATANPLTFTDPAGLAVVNVTKIDEKKYQTLAQYKNANPCNVAQGSSHYSCTQRLKQDFGCICSCKGMGYGMDVQINVELRYHLAGGLPGAPHPTAFYWNGYRDHEDIHLKHLKTELDKYAAKLESERYDGIDKCNIACGTAIGGFGDWLNKWAISSNNTFH